MQRETAWHREVLVEGQLCLSLRFRRSRLVRDCFAPSLSAGEQEALPLPRFANGDGVPPLRY
mgnify:CR=1 FL=1